MHYKAGKKQSKLKSLHTLILKQHMANQTKYTDT